ncbi:MAG TPA: hypothetical protein VGJ28_10840 [Micromonosporaceae bacterium]|jgi:hypothetical protein
MPDHEQVSAIGAQLHRVFPGAMAALRPLGGPELMRRHPPGFGALLIEFRTALAWPDGSVSAADHAEVARYRDADEERAAVRAAVARGSISQDELGTVRATGSGHAFLDDLYETQDRGLDRIWAGHADRVARLADVFVSVLAAAERTGGGAFAAMAPPFQPAGASDRVRLLNQLSTMRYHRSDAHAAAWRERGRTAAEMLVMPAGRERDAIEARTDELAAPPYAHLDADVVATIISDLAALPI